MSEGEDAINLHEYINRFRRRLIDLGKRNRLLSYRESKRTSIRIVDELPDQIYDHLVGQSETFYFDADEYGIWANAEDQIADLADRPTFEEQPHRRHQDNRLQTRVGYEDLQKSLNSIRTKANTAIEETGVNYLFVAVGFLEWFENPDSKRSSLAPLVLIPVRINRSFDESVGEYVYSLDPTGEDIQSNYALIELMAQDFGIVIPEFDPDEKPEAYFKQIERAISNRVSRDDRWRIVRRANLGFFSFAKLLMYKDLDPENWPEDRPLDKHPLLRQFFTGAGGEPAEGADGLQFRQDYHIDDHPKGQEVAIVDNADSSQHSALIDIHNGDNLVIEGPPGTGKSQTITNAIAAAIAEGKTVLFVSEKLAALEVVRERMDKLGLGDFCLELHSEKATPRQVLDDLATRLNGHYPNPRQIENKKALLAGEKKQIAEYLSAVTQTIGPHDDPLHDVFWRAVGLSNQGATNLESVELDLGWDITEFEKRCRLLDSLGRYIEEIGDPMNHPWFGFFCPTLRGENAIKTVQKPLEDVMKHDQVINHLIDQLLLGQPDEVKRSFRCLSSSKILSGIKIDLLSSAPIPQEALKNDLLNHLAGSRESRTRVNQFCEVVEQNRVLKERIEHLTPKTPQETQPNARCISGLLRGVFSDCLEKIKVNELRQLREVCRNALGLLVEIDGYIETLCELGQSRPDYLSGLEDALSQHDLMLRSGGFDWSLITARHYLTGASTALNRARETAQVLDQRREEAGRRVRLDTALDRNDLKSLSASLSLYQNKRFRFLSTEYRKLWGDVKTLLLPPTPKITEAAQLLERTHDYQQACIRLKEHRETATELGPIFTGIDTDWDHAQQMIEWATDARTRGLGYEQAKRLKTRYEEANDLPSAEQIHDVVKLLLSEIDVPLLKMVMGEMLEEVNSFSLEHLRSKLRGLEQDVSELIEKASVFNTDSETTLGQLMEMATAIHDFLEAKKSIDASDSQLRPIIGQAFAGMDTDLDFIKGSLRWSEQIADAQVPAPMRDWIFGGEIKERQELLSNYLGRVGVITQKYEAAIHRLYELGNCEPSWLPEDDPCRLLERCEELLNTLPQLPRWADWCRMFDQAKQLGIDAFIQVAEQGEIKFNRLRDSFELTFYKQLAESMANDHPVLRSFTRMDIEEARARFKELDEEVIRLERKAVAAKAVRRDVPYGVGSGKVKDLTEQALIEHEIPKQKRLCRVRQLMSRAQGAIKALKPCFMMSPLSVAQFLPKGEIAFDLVIFDEASQVKPEDALGAIVRGDQAVVVGDPKQLPPTSFFDKLSEEEIEEDDLTLADETESILEVAMKSRGTARRLKWHYRSQHESLIAFSNDRFYDSELVVFPSPVKGEASKAGVFLHEVEGATYIPKRGNRVEAEAVANAIVDHALKHPDETLGVGCFNLIQKELIAECLDQRCSEDPAARHAISKKREEHHETLFVKNLENLQGDERDVIFISYGWAPEKLGEKLGPSHQKTAFRTSSR